MSNLIFLQHIAKKDWEIFSSVIQWTAGDTSNIYTVYLVLIIFIYHRRRIWTTKWPDLQKRYMFAPHTNTRVDRGIIIDLRSANLQGQAERDRQPPRRKLRWIKRGSDVHWNVRARIILPRIILARFIISFLRRAREIRPRKIIITPGGK